MSAQRQSGEMAASLSSTRRADVTVVITSLNQGAATAAAVRSALRQTVRPARIIVVDCGSADPESVAALDELASLEGEGSPDVSDASDAHGGVTLIRQPNAGVSAARNTGIAAACTPYVCVLDGDDLLLPGFLSAAVAALDADPSAVAASSWLKCYGVLDCVVRPGGGAIEEFLPRNAAPADCVFRRDLWERCGGYDESMREGLEDWEFYLRLLEAAGGEAGKDAGSVDSCGQTEGDDPRIGTSPVDGPHVVIVPEPLINYRTEPGDSGVKGMRRRTGLLGQIIERHRASYAAHMESALLALDGLASERLRLWEDAVQVHPELRQHSMLTRAFMEHPTFGDGGMDAAVRINRARCSAPYYPSEDTPLA